jgi:hypothetical protein
MAKHEQQAYERPGLLLLIGGYLESTLAAEFKVDPLPAWAWTLLVIALAVLVIGFASTFVTRARRPASSELSDLTETTA